MKENIIIINNNNVNNGICVLIMCNINMWNENISNDKIK